MNDKWNDELSAYLDGEAKDPERIRRLLAEDPEAAARHAQLAKLSEHLRALPEPEVRPEFLTRVMAHVREQEMAPRRPAWHFGVPLLAFAMLALAIGGSLLTTKEVQAPVDPTAVAVVTPEFPDSVDEFDLTNDDVVIAQLAALFEEGTVSSDTAGDYYAQLEGEAEGEAVEEDYAVIWDILDDTGWEDGYEDFFQSESDWYSESDDLSDAEWVVFDEVLNEYVNEDLS